MSTDLVRTAINNLVEALIPTGSRLAIVEFDTRARRVPLNGSIELQNVDASLIPAVSNYLSNDYNPDGDVNELIGGTNWEDALLTADMVSGGELILILTDGRPTFYNTSMGMTGVAGEGILFDLTALKQAQDAANIVKDQSKHIFVVGLDFPTQVQPLIDISGPNQFMNGQDPVDILSSDFTLIQPTELAGLFGSLGDLCQVEVVPTVGEWGVIILALLIMVLSVVALKSSRTASGLRRV